MMMMVAEMVLETLHLLKASCRTRQSQIEK
jgi:hypothetical protein